MESQVFAFPFHYSVRFFLTTERRCLSSKFYVPTLLRCPAYPNL